MCERYCDYFKRDREDESVCRGIMALQRLHEAGHVFENFPDRGNEIDPEIDAIIARSVCAECEWRDADCDYRDTGAGLKASPCGGVVLLALLLAAGEIDKKDIQKFDP